jgi:hypothetical protein
VPPAIRRFAPILGATLLPATALAEPVGTHGDPERPCSAVSGDVVRWTPADGLPARFVAGSFVRDLGVHRWIGLGASDEGFWSAESGPGSDACDDCATLHLVLTRFDGTRRAFPVIDSADRSRLEGQPREALRDLALRRLWHLAATVWPVNDLRQGYTLRLPPRRDAEGMVDPYPGWMVETSERPMGATWLLRFGLASSSFMCWCHTGWRGFALAAPRAK